MIYNIPFHLLLQDFYLSFSIMTPMVVYLLYLGHFRLPMKQGRRTFCSIFAKWSVITILLIFVLAISSTTAEEAGIALIMTSGYAAITWIFGFALGFLFSYIFRLPNKDEEIPKNANRTSIITATLLVAMSIYLIYN